MKTLYALLFGLTLLTLSCKKEVNQVKLLPAATQTGANRLGCLVNGRAFVPENISIITGPELKAQYYNAGHGYMFTLTAGDKPGDGSSNYLSIQVDSLQISDGATVPLTQSLASGLSGIAPGTAGADYNVFSTNSSSALGKSYYTNTSTTGQLTITHLDTDNQIISGTFQFTAVAPDGETVSITDGRFDLRYMP